MFHTGILFLNVLRFSAIADLGRLAKRTFSTA
jgi:hypothetical protein